VVSFVEGMMVAGMDPFARFQEALNPLDGIVMETSSAPTAVIIARRKRS
jgi:hypothetical protein